MHNRNLPPRPSMVQSRHEGKDLLKAVRSGNADALVRLRQARPPSRPPTRSHPPASTNLPRRRPERRGRTRYEPAAAACCNRLCAVDPD
jgi:hypothetical protein